MKSNKKYLSVAAGALVAITGLTGCQDNFDTPPLDIPQATMKANTTIADFKAEYWDDATNYAKLVGKNAEGEDIIVKGRVISSDASGNIYKSLVIQDETAALPLSINQNSLYNEYRVGQEIYINLTDMYVGKYAGYQQMGALGEYNGTAQTSFMTYATFTDHSELNGLPDPELTYVQANADRPGNGIYCLNADIASLPTDAAGVRAWQGQLVIFRGVHFEGGGSEPFVAESDYNQDPRKSTSRNLLDSKGNSIVVRNSGYASFAQSIMPAGTGDVRGILSYFNGSWQLLLRTTADLIFDTKGTQEDPYSVEEAIKEQGNGIMGWTKGYIVGSVKAGVSNVTSDNDIIWGQNADMDNTLVIGQTPQTKSIREALLVALPQGSDFRKYGNLADNPGVYGKSILVYGAFENYLGMNGITGNTGTASEFKIDGVTIGGGDQPSTNPVTSLFCNFDNYSVQIDNLKKAGWTVTHTEGDRDWFLKDFNGNTYASANSYNAKQGPWEMWLITPAIDITKASRKTLEFVSQAAYNPGSSSIEVFVLTGNDPKTAQKTLLNAKFADVPESGYSSWISSGTVDLSSFSGVIYIGWCYKSSSATTSTTYCIDNVNVGGASEGGDTPDTPDTPTGAGSKDDPYDIAYVQKTTTDQTGVWVEGYVVGYIIGGSWKGGATFSNDLTGVSEDYSSGYSNANLILGATSATKTVDNCIPIHTKTSVRDVLSMRSNPGIYLKHIKVKGDIIKYFGVRGVKNIAEYEILD